jgi:hypothetical protein
MLLMPEGPNAAACSTLPISGDRGRIRGVRHAGATASRSVVVGSPAG